MGHRVIPVLLIPSLIGGGSLHLPRVPFLPPWTHTVVTGAQAPPSQLEDTEPKGWQDSGGWALPQTAPAQASVSLRLSAGPVLVPSFLGLSYEVALREQAKGLRKLGQTKQTKQFHSPQTSLSRGRCSGITLVHYREKVKRQKHTERIRELNDLKNLVRGQMIQEHSVEVTAGTRLGQHWRTTLKATGKPVSYPFFWYVSKVLPGAGNKASVNRRQF